MSKPNHRPTVLTDSVRIETTIPREVNNAIDAVVAGSGGMSRATILRQIITAGLAPYAVVSSEVAAALEATPYGRKQP